MKNFTIAIIIMLVASLGGYFMLQNKQPIKVSSKKSKIVEVAQKDNFSFDIKGVAFVNTEYIQESDISFKRKSLEEFDKPKENSLGVFGERESPADPSRYSVGFTYKLKLDP